MNADALYRRCCCTLMLLSLAGCGGTIASVHLPPLPDPGPSKFESFEDWDRRTNPTTTTAPATTQSTTRPTL